MWGRGPNSCFCSHDTQLSQHPLLKSLLITLLLTVRDEWPVAMRVYLWTVTSAPRPETNTLSQLLSLSHTSWSWGVSPLTLFFFSLAILCPLHFLMKEEPFISFCEKARWEPVGNPVVSMAVLPVCGPEWARLFRSVLFCNKKLAVFRVQLLHFSCSTCIPKYFIFLDAVLVLFLFSILIAGT